MAKQFIDDGEKGFIVRKKINENFSELYSNDTLWLSGKDLSLNSLTKYGNANTLLNSIVYDTGSLVGIGTVSPHAKLHVAGGNIVGYSGNLSTYTGLVVRNRSNLDYTIDGRIIVDTVNTPNKVIIGSETNHPLQIITNNTQRVWIDSTGVTTSGNLNVAGDVTITGNLSALGTTTKIDTQMYVTSAVSITNTGGGPALYVKQTGTNDIATFLDDSNIALIVKDGGKVGIGTDSPTRTLNVFGNPTLNGSNRSILGLMDTSSIAAGIGGGLDFGGIYNIAGNYAEWAGIKGIKENSTSGDEAASLVFSTRSSGSFTSEKMRITSDGKVGIGTDLPQKKLHLKGTLRLEGLPTFSNNATAIAGGLVTDDVYKTSTGELRIVV